MLAEQQTAVDKQQFSNICFIHFTFTEQFRRRKLFGKCQHRKGFIKQGLPSLVCQKGKKLSNTVETMWLQRQTYLLSFGEFARSLLSEDPERIDDVNDVNLPESTGSSRR